MSKGGRLVTGNAGHSLKLWSTAFIGECRLQNETNVNPSLTSLAPAGVTLDDEMSLDGMPISATFDDTLDMVRSCITHYSNILCSCALVNVTSMLLLSRALWERLPVLCGTSTGWTAPAFALLLVTWEM